MYMRSYQGDPGFFSSLGKIFKKVLPIAVGFATGGPLGAVVAGAGSLVGGRGAAPPIGAPGARARAAPGMRLTRVPAAQLQTFPGGAPSAALGIPSARQIAQRLVPGGATGFARRRRMNVANPKALRRAIRRQAGFVKLARKALKGSGYTIVTRGSGRRRPINVREAGSGSVTIQS